MGCRRADWTQVLRRDDVRSPRLSFPSRLRVANTLANFLPFCFSSIAEVKSTNSPSLTTESFLLPVLPKRRLSTSFVLLPPSVPSRPHCSLTFLLPSLPSQFSTVTESLVHKLPIAGPCLSLSWSPNSDVRSGLSFSPALSSPTAFD